jgi:hypothetical protein
MKRTVFAFLWILICPVLIQAASYCSLIVNVDAQRSASVHDPISVVVEEESGQKTERLLRRNPVEFCGLGIRPVTVTVGPPGCNQVVVKNVPVVWNKTRTLSIAYDDSPCWSDSIPAAACTFLFRINGAGDRPLPSASLILRGPVAENEHADDYGRILVTVPAGQEFVGMVSASGYQSVQISIPCVSDNRIFEKVLRLDRVER